jgi:outer membrane biosynthesis protein TonB
VIAALLVLVAAVLLAVAFIADVQALGVAALVVAAVAVVLLLAGTFQHAASADTEHVADEQSEREPDPEPEPNPKAEPHAEPACEPEHEAEPEPEAPEVPAPVETVASITEPAPADDLVLVSPGRHRYHRPGCDLLGDRDVEPLTEEEALEEGFSACSRCAG